MTLNLNTESATGLEVTLKIILLLRIMNLMKLMPREVK